MSNNKNQPLNVRCRVQQLVRFVIWILAGILILALITAFMVNAWELVNLMRKSPSAGMIGLGIVTAFGTIIYIISKIVKWAFNTN